MAAAKKSSKAVDVVDVNGEYIRTYSEEENGKDYKKLAEVFAKKHSESPVGDVQEWKAPFKVVDSTGEQPEEETEDEE